MLASFLYSHAYEHSRTPLASSESAGVVSATQISLSTVSTVQQCMSHACAPENGAVLVQTTACTYKKRGGAVAGTDCRHVASADPVCASRIHHHTVRSRASEAHHGVIVGVLDPRQAAVSCCGGDDSCPNSQVGSTAVWIDVERCASSHMCKQPES